MGTPLRVKQLRGLSSSPSRLATAFCYTPCKVLSWLAPIGTLAELSTASPIVKQIGTTISKYI